MAVTFVAVPDGGATTFVSWLTAGVAFTVLDSPVTVAYTGAAGSVVCTNPDPLVEAGKGFERRDQSTGGWGGNFKVGDRLLWTGRIPGSFSPGPMEIVFSSPVYGAGAQIQADDFGGFVGHLDVYVGADVTSFTVAGTASGAADDSAPYMGCLSDAPNITKIVYWVTEADTPPTNNDFAINQLDLVLTPAAAAFLFRPRRPFLNILAAWSLGLPVPLVLPSFPLLIPEEPAATPSNRHFRVTHLQVLYGLGGFSGGNKA